MSKHLQRLLLGIALSFTAVVAPFLQAWINNVTDLQVPLAALSKPMWVFAAAMAVLLWGVMSVLPGRIRSPAVVVMTYLLIVFWLQSNFFIGEFGFLDGTEPDWSASMAYGYIQLMIFAALAGLFWWQWQTVSRNITFIATLVLLLGLASLGLAWQGKGPEPERRFVFTDDGVFDLSVGKNVLVFVVDAVQADVVNQILLANPALAEEFSGFTFYRNTVGPFPKTYASVPAMLTGQMFDNSQPLGEFLRESYLEQSIPMRLQEEGFDVRLHSSVPQALLADPLIADNVQDSTSGAASFSVLADLELLVNIATFRLAPHVIKPFVYNDGEFLVALAGDERIPGECSLDQASEQLSKSNRAFDARFYDEFHACVRTVVDQPVFRFIHLEGGHAPILFDENFSFVGSQVLTPGSYRKQVEGTLRQLANVFDKLKALSVYQEATIVIAGDHGGGEYGIGLDLAQAGLPPRVSASGATDRQLVMGGIPVLLVKPGGVDRQFSVDDRPTSTTDIPKTIYDDLGLAVPDAPGESIFEIDPNASRIRVHRHYQYSGWNIDYIVPLDEYHVEGFSWYPESWQRSGRDLTVNATRNFDGRLISFSATEKSLSGVLDGFSLTSDGSELVSRQGRVFANYKANGAQLLQLAHKRMPETGVDEQLTVSLGGSVLATWRFPSGSLQFRKSAVIPRDQVSQLASEPLVFHTSVSKSRVHFKELRLSAPHQDYGLGTTLDFREGTDSGMFLPQGWSVPNVHGTPSVGVESGILLQLAANPTSDLVAQMTVKPVLRNVWQQQRVEIFVNERPLGSLTLADNQHDIRFPIPVADIADGVIDIRISYLTPLRPIWLGSTDSRRLAIDLAQLIVEKSAGLTEQLTRFEPKRTCAWSGDRRLDCSDVGSVEATSKVIKGYLDGVRETTGILRLIGWAANPMDAGDEITLHAFSNGKWIGRTTANRSRAGIAGHLDNPALTHTGFDLSVARAPVNRETLQLVAVSRSGEAIEIRVPKGSD